MSLFHSVKYILNVTKSESNTNIKGMLSKGRYIKYPTYN